MPYLIEAVQELGDQRRARTWRTERIHEAKVSEVANESAGPAGGESQRVAPKVPLERNDGERCHTTPDQTERRFPSCKARIQEA